MTRIALAATFTLVLLGSWTALGQPPDAPTGAGTACQPSLGAGRHTLVLDSLGTPREVAVQIPALEPGARPPAVIAFHGYTSHAWEIEETSGLTDLAAEHGFIVAYPEALGDPTMWRFSSTFATPIDIDLTDDLIDALIEQACADPGRIVLAGHSMGGGMASDAACQLSDRVAGAALIAALWFDPPCAPARPVPIVATHSLDDPVLPYGGGPLPELGPAGPVLLPVEDAIGRWAAHDQCGNPPDLEESADGSAVLSWPDCAAPVVLHRLPTGAHDWPAIASGLIVELVAATG